MITDLDQLFSTAPYPGLRPFDRRETDIYFGREKQTLELLRRLKERRFVGVVGSSGSGKSSLIRAGLIASLETGLIAEAGASWRVAEMRPGTRPLLSLAEALVLALGPEYSSDPNAVSFLFATLCRGPLGLTEVLRENPLPADTNLLVFVDQFEEIFRFRGDDRPGLSPPAAAGETWQAKRDESEAFVALLLETLQHTQRVYVLLTMRTDYLGNCAVFQGLPEALNSSQYLIPQLTREERRSAIVGPAKVFGGEVHPELVNRLLNDSVDPAQLPLLQHVLMRMRAQKKQESGAEAGNDKLVVTLDDYKRTGTIKEALSRHAKEVYDNLGGKPKSGPKRIAEVVFRALTERASDKRDRRRPLKWPDLLALTSDLGSEAQVKAVVDAFRKPDCNFLMPPEKEPLNDNATIDISHESLITHWTLLQEWVSAEADSADKFRRYTVQAEAYQAGEGRLLNKLALENALKWRTDEKPTEAWATRYGGNLVQVEKFIEDSRQQENAEQIRGRRKKQLLIGSAILFYSLFLVVWVLWKDGETARKGEQRYRDIAALATKNLTQANYNAELATKNLVKAYFYKGQAEAESSKPLSALPYFAEVSSRKGEFRALEKLPPAITYGYGIQHSAGVQTLALDPTGNWLAAVLTNGRIEVVKIGTRTIATNLTTPAKTASGEHNSSLLAFDPKGRWLVFSDFGTRPLVWSTDTWQPVATNHLLTRPFSSAVRSLAFSPDGETLAFGLSRGDIILRALNGNEEIKITNQIPVLSLSFHPGGQLLAGHCLGDAQPRIWGVKERGEVCEIPTRFSDEDIAAGCVIFHPSGQFIATGSEQGEVSVWTLINRGQASALRPFNSPSPNLGAAGKIDKPDQEVSEARRLSSPPRPYSLSKGPWRPPRRTPDTRLRSEPKTVNREILLSIRALEFTRSGDALLWLSGDEYGNCWWWNGDRSGDEDLFPQALFFKAHNEPASAIATASDGTWLATASRDGTSRLWQMATPEKRREGLQDTLPPIVQLRATENGTQIIAAGADKRGVRIWNPKQEKVETISRKEIDEESIWLSGDGSKLLLLEDKGEESLVTVDLATRRFSPSILTSQLGDSLDTEPDLNSRDGQIAFISGENILLYNNADGTKAQELGPVGSEMTVLHFSRSGRWLTAACKNGVLLLWDRDKPGNQPLRFGPVTPWEQNENIEQLAFSGDEQRIALASDEGHLWFCDLRTKQLKNLPFEKETETRAFALNWNGTKLATVGTNGMLLIDLATAEPRKLPFPPVDTDEISSMVFLRDDRLVLAADGPALLILENGRLSTNEPPQIQSWLPTATNGWPRMSGLRLNEFQIESFPVADEDALGIRPTDMQDAALADYWNIQWLFVRPVLESLEQRSLGGREGGPFSRGLNLPSLEKEEVQRGLDAANRMQAWLFANTNHAKAASLQDERASILKDLAQALADDGFRHIGKTNWIEAENKFSEALKIKPGLGFALVGRAFVYFQLNRLQDANNELHSLQAGQRTVIINELVAEATRDFRFGEFPPLIAGTLVVWLDETNVLAHLAKGVLEFRYANYTTTVTALDIALAKAPTPAPPWLSPVQLLRGRALRFCGRTNEADAIFREFIANTNSARQSRQYMSFALALSGDFSFPLPPSGQSEGNGPFQDDAIVATIYALRGDARKSQQDYLMGAKLIERSLEWTWMRADRVAVFNLFLKDYPEAKSLEPLVFARSFEKRNTYEK